MSSLNNSNTPGNVTEYSNVDVMPVGLHWFINSLMVITTLLGAIGNSLVCYFFYKKKVKLTSFNMLLLNLSIADLLADAFAYPHIFVDLRMLRDFSQADANILCALTIGITPFGVVTGVTILTISYISVNRFVSVRYPFKTSFFKSRKCTAWILVIFWLWSTAYIIPNGFAFRFDYYGAVCYREWPETINGVAWTIVGLFLVLIIPITIMIVSFFSTLHHFKVANVGETVEQRESMERRKRAVKLLGYLILTYFICWGPSSIYLLISIALPKVWPEGDEGQYARMRAIRVTFLITLTNTVMDPIIYGYHNREFQKCFKEVFNAVSRNIPSYSNASSSMAAGRASQPTDVQSQSNVV